MLTTVVGKKNEATRKQPLSYKESNPLIIELQ